MIRIFPFLISTILLFVGCASAPQFKVFRIDDKFSKPDDPYGMVGENNRLSTKSTTGGIHIDNKGIYLDPFIFRSRINGNILSSGFYVSHYNFDSTGAFLPIREVIFLLNGKDLIEAKVSDNIDDFHINGWNTVSREYNTTFTEKGIARMPFSDLTRIARSNSVEVKIRGDKRICIYSANDILPSFLPNIKMFVSQIDL